MSPPPPPEGDRPHGEGPDGSSLKPVSSLLARFENLNKAPPPASTPQGPSRPISPAPKPDRLRDFRPLNDIGPPASSPTWPVVPPKPKEFHKTPSIPLSKTPDEPPATPVAAKPPVPAKSQTIPKPTPAVNVLPPQSPPKQTSHEFKVAVDQSPFLNPETAATPATPTNGSPRLPKAPSRPITPTPNLPPPRSPRLTSSQPPSPPPPRRSGEIRREREGKPQPPPPPAPRNERNAVSTNRAAHVSDTQVDKVSRKTHLTEETSPFNSPPASPEESDGETPPALPTRPRPAAEPRQDVPPRPKSSLEGYQPPPIHHAVAGRKKDRELELNGFDRGVASSQRNGETYGRQYGALQVPDASSKYQASDAAEPPPRPPRPVVAPVAAETDRTMAPPKRNVSAAASQLAPPPTRTHGRSKTVDDGHSRQIVEPPVNKTTVSHASQPVGSSKLDPKGHITTFPDATNTNRRPPFAKKGCYEIITKYDPRVFDVCGDYVCTSGNLTRVWSISDGELLMSLAHTEGIKATTVAFKPAADPRDEGTKLWIGTSNGEIMEVDIATQTISTGRGSFHGRLEVIRIYRHFNELWTLDEGGTLLIWGPDEDGVPNLGANPTQNFKMPRGHTFSMIVDKELWHATGKEMRVFSPTLDGRNQFQVLIRPLMAEGAGEITSGTLVRTQPGKVFLGHSDGKVSVWSSKDYSCSAILSISAWKITSLVGIGSNMWAAYNSGKICVYDMTTTPWTVKKEWQAHDNPIVTMKLDKASAYRLDRLQVLSLGADNKVRAWDALLQEDWIEEDLKSKEESYCQFDEIRALLLTWNAGASTPHGLNYSGNDQHFFPDLLKASGSPEILIFGFQELVDLEDKTATAKRLFKPKKKEGTDQERMSHQYRDWRDYLIKTLDDIMPAGDLYHLLQSAPMVGLFTCIFVKASIRDRIRNLSHAEVKRGMGGLHGNKGAVAIRFQIDDTSLCFVNCHLAAGQTQATSRHNDVAAILESNIFPPERDSDTRMDSFTGGGDGTMILDHELCILSGDLNYRIDTMSRDTVVMAVKQRNLAKLLDRDQLLVARRRNATFRLRLFEEMPITFAPTYKYDVGTNNYDTSEKKRSPAWCDRMLHKGRGRIQQMDYRRHEVVVSDHRPVSGSFRMWVKTVQPRERATAWMQSQQAFETLRQRALIDGRVYYLRDTCGFDEATSKKIAKEGSRR